MGTVLIVDDAVFMRRMIAKLVVASGHRVVGDTADGSTAVELFGELRPDLVVLDITLPGRDGLEVLCDIVRLDPQARVLLCGGAGQQARLAEGLRLGARDFLVKPFERDTVRVALERVLS